MVVSAEMYFSAEANLCIFPEFLLVISVWMVSRDITITLVGAKI